MTDGGDSVDGDCLPELPAPDLMDEDIEHNVSKFKLPNMDMKLDRQQNHWLLVRSTLRKREKTNCLFSPWERTEMDYGSNTSYIVHLFSKSVDDKKYYLHPEEDGTSCDVLKLRLSPVSRDLFTTKDIKKEEQKFFFCQWLDRQSSKTVLESFGFKGFYMSFEKEQSEIVMRKTSNLQVSEVCCSSRSSSGSESSSSECESDMTDGGDYRCATGSFSSLEICSFSLRILTVVDCPPGLPVPDLEMVWEGVPTDSKIKLGITDVYMKVDRQQMHLVSATFSNRNKTNFLFLRRETSWMDYGSYTWYNMNLLSIIVDDQTYYLHPEEDGSSCDVLKLRLSPVSRDLYTTNGIKKEDEKFFFCEWRQCSEMILESFGFRGFYMSFEAEQSEIVVRKTPRSNFQGNNFIQFFPV